MVQLIITAENILVTTLSNIISNLAWFILIYWSVKTIAKKMPSWIEQYFKLKRDQDAIDRARSGMGR